MAEVDKLTLEIEDKASKSTDGIDTLITKLEKLEKQMDGTIPKMQKLANSFGGLNKTTKKAPNLTPSQQQGTDMSNTSALNKLSRAVNFTAFTAGAYKAGQAFSKLLRTANDYIETQNLFEVVMGDSTRQAWNFVESLESIGVNQEQAMRYQGSFYDLANSLGVSSKNAYTLSEQFTKLAYDYASLYNMDPDATFQKLQAGITGTVEPLRRLGKDVSEVRLQETARRLGIQESVRNMTQAQKTELRFIAIMEQSKSAMNDMERTIDQPTNALRVLRAQLTSLAREFGSLFIPALSAVLPYLIAFIKFIRTIVAEIAGFFGVKLKAIDFSGVNSQINNTAKGTGDTAKNLKKSADNAKKLKDYILGIDELNVLNDDGSVSRDTGASGSGSSGGVGDLGLDLSKYGYDDLLKNINSKANQIYETFMKWKKPLMTIAGILAGIWTIGKITNFIRALKGVQTTSNFVAGLQGIGGLARAFFNLAGSGGILGTRIELVVDVAHNLLQQILHSHEAGGAAVLVHHNGQVDLPALHVAEELIGAHRLGHEIGRAQQLPHRAGGGFAGVEQPIAGVQDADDVIGVLLIHRETGQAGGLDGLRDLLRRVVHPQHHHVGAVDHHVPGGHVVKFEDVLDHLLLTGLDGALLLADVHHHADAFL